MAKNENPAIGDGGAPESISSTENGRKLKPNRRPALAPSPEVAAATIRVTIFPNEKASTLEAKDLTLEELRTVILKETAAKKEALPLLKMATFGDKRSGKNCLRTNANVETMSGVKVEYDEGITAFEDAVAVLKTNKLHALIYTSPSYKVEKPKWRILLPTSVAIPPGKEGKTRYVARLNGLFGGQLCIASWTLSQSYYYGSVNNNPDHRAEIIPGDYIDLRGDLDAGALAKATLPKPERKPRGG